MLKNARKHRAYYSRTPHGVRGLKLHHGHETTDDRLSHPSRGAWIEMSRPVCAGVAMSVAPLTGCVD